jgi:GT2 family glycosyltransferase
VIPCMVVPILNRPELLDRMLSSVDHPVDTLVIIDNGGVVDPSLNPQWASRTHVLTMPSNLGVATSWNLGIKSTPFAPWWLIVNSDVTWRSGLLARFDTGDAREVLRLSGCIPPWCAFGIGEDVVNSVGLFDEAIHPAYFEDTDYERRCKAAGVPIHLSGITVDHDNSSTLDGGYHDANARTYAENRAYSMSKSYRGDMSEGRWSLKRRRDLSWD